MPGIGGGGGGGGGGGAGIVRGCRCADCSMRSAYSLILKIAVKKSLRPHVKRS